MKDEVNKKELESLEKILTALNAKYRKVIIDGIFSANSTIEDINEYLAIDEALVEIIARLKKLKK